MTDPITIRINRRLPSQNLWNNKRGIVGSLVYKKERDAWYSEIMAALSKLGPMRKDRPGHKVYARIVSYRSVLLDYGNLVGGAKPIPDCLRDLGWIKDDSPAWFECEYVQHKCPRKDEVTIIVVKNP